MVIARPRWERLAGQCKSYWYKAFIELSWSSLRCSTPQCYSVEDWGQAGKQDQDMGAADLPTLCQSSYVLSFGECDCIRLARFWHKAPRASLSSVLIYDRASDECKTGPRVASHVAPWILSTASYTTSAAQTHDSINTRRLLQLTSTKWPGANCLSSVSEDESSGRKLAHIAASPDNNSRQDGRPHIAYLSWRLIFSTRSTRRAYTGPKESIPISKLGTVRWAYVNVRNMRYIEWVDSVNSSDVITNQIKSRCQSNVKKILN